MSNGLEKLIKHFKRLQEFRERLWRTCQKHFQAFVCAHELCEIRGRPTSGCPVECGKVPTRFLMDKPDDQVILDGRRDWPEDRRQPLEQEFLEIRAHRFASFLCSDWIRLWLW